MLRTLFLAVVAAAAVSVAPSARAERVLVFAAASLKDALDAAISAYDAAEVVASYGGSAQMARQIDYGAPAEAFISANVAWMDHLERRGGIDPATRVDLLGNRLVLIAPAEAGNTPKTITAALTETEGRIAAALTQAVPAGIYAKAALTHLEMWTALRPRIIETDNVRVALALAARGEVPLGIVYATDAQAEPRVRVVGLFPEDSHPPIVYPAAATPEASPAAKAFLHWLAGGDAADIFAAHGFAPIGDGAQ